jgi:hypothetical protein
MSWGVASDVVWVALAIITCALAAAARSSSQVMTFGRLTSRLVARPVTRGALLLGWAWLGWHTFVR